MPGKQILALFVCSLVPWLAGNGMSPLLPVYATRLGADSAVSGYFMAFSFLGLAIGAISAGWISDKLQRRKTPLIIAGLVSLPVTWLMGHASNVLELSLLTGLSWLFGGMGLALIGILTGLSARESERGKIFGILSLTSGLGAVLGSLFTGYFVDHWGFTTMFSTLAVFLILWPLTGLFLTEIEVKPAYKEDGQVGKRPGLGRSFYLFFTASLLASTAGYTILLGRSLIMDGLGFKAMEISSTGAISGLVVMPLPLLLGWLSDRTGRKIYIYFAYLAGILSLCILAVSSSLWHFWIVVIFQGIFMAVGSTLGSALVTDIVKREALGRGLALFSAMGWIGGVLGYTEAGFILQRFGLTVALIIAICLILAATVFLALVRTAKRIETLAMREQ